VLSTGIGTDNIDICLQELDALVNIDLVKREEKQTKQSLEIVRIGTCGILQKAIPVHSFILSTHALGLDNVAHFYPIPFDENELQLLQDIKRQITFPTNVLPYLSAANSDLVKRMQSEQVHCGITITSSGFYGPQGRSLRLESNMRDIHLQLGAFQNKEHRIMNFEMESSAIFALGKALGHRCTTLCLGVANRPNEEFSTGIDSKMDELILYVLDRI
jgi:uridine phosphorylase